MINRFLKTFFCICLVAILVSQVCIVFADEIETEVVEVNQTENEIIITEETETESSEEELGTKDEIQAPELESEISVDDKFAVAINPDITSFVSRLYTLVLNRNPDPAGLNDWSEKLADGRETGASVGYGFVFSQEFKSRNKSNADYVEILYNTFLNRASDPTGKRNWVAALDKGTTRASVFKGFVESKEYRGLCKKAGIEAGTYTPVNNSDVNDNVTQYVYRCYKVFLDRAPDAPGLNNWTGVINNNKQSIQRVTYGFVFSKEFASKRYSNKDFVTRLYRGLFDREPDEVGFNNWVNLLKKGANRITIFKGFIGSQEYRNMVSRYGLKVSSDSLSDCKDLIPQLSEIGSPAYMAYDVNSDRIICSKNIDVTRNIASQTKLLTALVVLDNVQSLEEQVTFSYADVVGYDYEKVAMAGLIGGRTYTVEMLLKGLLVYSGADCAECLARYVGGTKSNFVKMMNSKAKALGMTNYYFTDPVGLGTNYTTMRSYLKLAVAAENNQVIKSICALTGFYLQDVNAKQNSYLYSQNPFLNGWISSDKSLYTVDGLKTGYTGPAGYCLTTSAYDKYGNRVIGITWGGEDYEERNDDAKFLLDIVFKNDRMGYALLSQ